MAAEAGEGTKIPTLQNDDVEVGGVYYVYHQDGRLYKCKVSARRRGRVAGENAAPSRPCTAPAQVLARNGFGGEFTEFRVHYHGWNKKYDEDVVVERLVPITEETTKMVQELEARLRAKAAEAAAEAKSSKSKGTKRRRNESSAASAPSGDGGAAQAAKSRRKDAALKLPLSATHKTALVHDWEMIVNKRCLVRLPKPEGQTVKDLLDTYQSTLGSGADAEAAASVLRGVRLYFDRALPVCLLYRFERHQFDELLKKHLEVSPTKPYESSRVFGAEHLLRLLVKLPSLLEDLAVDAAVMASLSGHLNDFVRWLTKHAAKYLTQDFVRADTEYIAASVRLPEAVAVDLTLLPPLTEKEQQLSLAAQRAAAEGAAAPATPGS